MNTSAGEKWIECEFDTAFRELRLDLLSRGSTLVIVIGAGASVESGVPMGDEIRTRIERVLPDLWQHFSLSGASPTLEAFLDFVAASTPGDPRALISRLLSDCGIPQKNAVTIIPAILHLLVAKLAVGRIANLIVSLNFDEILERCLEVEWGEPKESGCEWMSLSTPEELSRVEEIIDRPGRSSKVPCVVLKPHGTISKPRSLIAAGRDVTQFGEPLKNVLKKALQEKNVRFLFLGCSFRDSDFFNLYRESKSIRARFYILDLPSPDKWMENSRKALGKRQHHFKYNSFEDCRIIYAQCSDRKEEINSTSPQTGTLPHSPRISTRINKLPGDALLEIMSKANQATGNLLEQNAPWVTDLEIHQLVRAFIVGKRPALRSFLATEILIGAAIENGVFNKERITNTRRHIEYAAMAGFQSLVDDIFDQFVEQGVFLRSSAVEYALRKVKHPMCRRALPALLGPLRDSIPERCGSNPDETSLFPRRLAELLIDLSEKKATMSNWTTDHPGDLITIERATPMVLDTTDELLVISEYGTWMRRARFKKSFYEAVKRAFDFGKSIKIIIASPPPPESQGYLEWVVSCLWLWKKEREGEAVRLRILDARKHTHHMNLGQQAAVDFKREGTANQLIGHKMTFGSGDIQNLRQVFDEHWAEAKSFDDWQAGNGLHLCFGDFGIQYLIEGDLRNISIQYDSEWNRSVSRPQLRQATLKWEEENGRRQKSGKPALENNPLFRPMRIEPSADRIVVSAGKTSYFDNLYLQTQADIWRDEVITGAGISVIPLCSDGRVLLGKRSGVVADGEGRFHVVGGHAHPDSTFESCANELNSAALEELEEEMHIEAADIDQIVFLGIAVNLLNSKPEFVVVARLIRESKYYIKNWNSRKTGSIHKYGQSEEFSEIVTLQSLINRGGMKRNTDGPFPVDFLFKIKSKMVPICRAVLLTWWIYEADSEIEKIEKYLC